MFPVNERFDRCFAATAAMSRVATIGKDFWIKHEVFHLFQKNTDPDYFLATFVTWQEMKSSRLNKMNLN
jgi:hypothetical protein